MYISGIFVFGNRRQVSRRSRRLKAPWMVPRPASSPGVTQKLLGGWPSDTAKISASTGGPADRVNPLQNLMGKAPKRFLRIESTARQESSLGRLPVQSIQLPHSIKLGRNNSLREETPGCSQSGSWLR